MGGLINQILCVRERDVDRLWATLALFDQSCLCLKIRSSRYLKKSNYSTAFAFQKIQYILARWIRVSGDRQE